MRRCDVKSTETANKGIYFIIHMKIKKQIPHKRISYGLAFFSFLFLFRFVRTSVCIYLVATLTVKLPTARTSHSIVSLRHQINQWTTTERMRLELADDCILILSACTMRTQTELNVSNWWVGVMHPMRSTCDRFSSLISAIYIDLGE